jgi:hypothetical protein
MCQRVAATVLDALEGGKETPRLRVALLEAQEGVDSKYLRTACLYDSCGDHVNPTDERIIFPTNSFPGKSWTSGAADLINLRASQELISSFYEGSNEQRYRDLLLWQAVQWAIAVPINGAHSRWNVLIAGDGNVGDLNFSGGPQSRNFKDLINAIIETIIGIAETEHTYGKKMAPETLVL